MAVVPSIRSFNRETYKFFQDLEFINEISKSVRCEKCLNLLREPIQLGCGHRYWPIVIKCDVSCKPRFM